jgi:hypothetical protein
MSEQDNIDRVRDIIEKVGVQFAGQTAHAERSTQFSPAPVSGV